MAFREMKSATIRRAAPPNWRCLRYPCGLRTFGGGNEGRAFFNSDTRMFVSSHCRICQKKRVFRGGNKLVSSFVSLVSIVISLYVFLETKGEIRRSAVFSPVLFTRPQTVP